MRWRDRWPAEEPLTPDKAALIPVAELRTKPFWKHRGLCSSVARNVPTGLLTTPEAAADFIANHEAELLARMIPAISGPAGSREVPDIPSNRNIDLQGFRNVPWPRPRTDGHDDPWWHRDHRRPAYVYVHGLYETIVDEHHLKLK